MCGSITCILYIKNTRYLDSQFNSRVRVLLKKRQPFVCRWYRKHSDERVDKNRDYVFLMVVLRACCNKCNKIKCQLKWQSSSSITEYHICANWNRFSVHYNFDYICSPLKTEKYDKKVGGCRVTHKITIHFAGGFLWK